MKYRITEVPKYIQKTYGVTVTRQTIYNWMKLGRNGRMLQSEYILGRHYIDKEEIDDFVVNL